MSPIIFTLVNTKGQSPLLQLPLVFWLRYVNDAGIQERGLSFSTIKYRILLVVLQQYRLLAARLKSREKQFEES